MDNEALENLNEFEETLLYLRVKIEAELPDDDNRDWAIEKCEELIRVLRFAIKSYVFDEAVKNGKKNICSKSKS